MLTEELDAGLTYGEAENITVHINKTEEGIYEIPEKDLRTLDQAMISQKKLEKESQKEAKEESGKTPEKIE